MLENVEGTIHRVIRIQDSGTEPARLETERQKETEVSIVYSSPKRLCHLAVGLVRGVARVYGEEIDTAQTECMHSGGARCVISVSRR